MSTDRFIQLELHVAQLRLQLEAYEEKLRKLQELLERVAGKILRD